MPVASWFSFAVWPPIDSKFVLQRKICTAASDIFGHLVSVKKTLVAVMSLFRID